jgi:hypothetical protein
MCLTSKLPVHDKIIKRPSKSHETIPLKADGTLKPISYDRLRTLMYILCIIRIISLHKYYRYRTISI